MLALSRIAPRLLSAIGLLHSLLTGALATVAVHQRTQQQWTDIEVGAGGNGGRQSIDSSSCSVGSYDLTPLAAQPAWVVKQPCIESSSEECIYYFSLCHALAGSLPNRGPNCEGSAVCVDRTAPNQTNEWSSLGGFDNYGAQALPNYPEFQVIYHINGSAVSPCRSILIFRCNENVSWAGPVVHDFQQIPSDALIAIHLFGDCSYIFQFHYDGACHVTSPQPATHLSVGSYVVVVLAAGILLYVVLGSLVQVARGHRGWDSIPHRDVWNALGANVVHGILFLLSPLRRRKSVPVSDDGGTNHARGMMSSATTPQDSGRKGAGEGTPLLH